MPVRRNLHRGARRWHAAFTRREAITGLLFGLAASRSAIAAKEDIDDPRGAAALPGTRSLVALIERAASHAEPVIVFFSRVDCPWCPALRRDQMVHLARDATVRGVQVIELDIADARAFATTSAPSAGLSAARSPADLATRLGVRVTPTVVFLGPKGELAERLIGYPSRDVYGAYLNERIEQARSALRTPSG